MRKESDLLIYFRFLKWWSLVVSFPPCMDTSHRRTAHDIKKLCCLNFFSCANDTIALDQNVRRDKSLSEGYKWLQRGTSRSLFI